MTLHRRLQTLAERLDAQAPSFDVLSAARQWLTVLNMALPMYEQEPRSRHRNVVIRRIRRSITLLEDSLARPNTPSASLEHFCRACLRRAAFASRCRRGRELAFWEDEYDRELAQVERRLQKDECTAPDRDHAFHSDE